MRGGPPGQHYHLEREMIFDSVLKQYSIISYYPSGVVRDVYKKNEKNEEVGDEISYSEEGYVTKILRIKKGEQNKFIYVDSLYWPNYKAFK